MSEKEYLAADLRGPLNVWQSTATGLSPSGTIPFLRNRPKPACEIVALVVPSGVSKQFDLSASGMFNTGWEGKFVRMISETAGDIWYAYAQATGTTIDRTATGGATGVPAFLPSKTYTDECPAGQYLVIQPSTNGLVRIWLTNSTRAT